jgi:hypothetical protein
VIRFLTRGETENPENDTHYQDRNTL